MGMPAEGHRVAGLDVGLLARGHNLVPNGEALRAPGYRPARHRCTGSAR